MTMKIQSPGEPIFIVYLYGFLFWDLAISLLNSQIREAGISFTEFENCNIPQPHVYYYKVSVVGSADMHGRIISEFFKSN